MKRLPLLLAVVALAGAACAGGASPAPSGSPAAASPGPTDVPDGSAPPTDRTGLLLRVDVGGGLVPPQVPLVQLPQVAIYADGRMITQGPMIEIYPGPALPNLQLTMLSRAGLDRVVDLARAADLVGPDRVLEAQGIADAPATVFTAVLDGRRHVTSAIALGIESGIAVPDTDLPVRRALLALEQGLADIRSVPGSVVGDDRPYAWTALRVVVTSDLGTDDPQVRPGVIAWPLQPGLDAFGEAVVADGSLRCGVLEGEQLAAIRAALAQANELTRWQSGATQYRLLLRPLYPDESGCVAGPAPTGA